MFIELCKNSVGMVRSKKRMIIKEKYIPTGEGGVDMIAITNEGIKLYVQCKNWESAVGVDVIRSFIGALDKFIINNQDMGIIVANTFSECAMREANTSKVTMVLTTPKDINKAILDIMTQTKT